MTLVFNVFDIVLLALACWYVGFLLWCAVGWRRLSQRPLRANELGSISIDADGPVEPRSPAQSGPRPGGLSVSVVVPARNEAGSVVECLSSILESIREAEVAHEATDPFAEAILVDDGSVDGTAQIATDRFADDIRRGRLKVISVEYNGSGSSGKHEALRHGMKCARGSHILTTDADCVVAEGWVGVMVHALEQGATVVAGPVACRAPARAGLFERIQVAEVAGLVAIGAGSIANGYPTICNSANLAYTRSAYNAWATESRTSHSGSSRAPGTDETIVLRAKALTGVPPRFVKDVEGLVFTQPTSTLRAFLEQRVRWAAMGGRYPERRVVYISLLVFAYFVSLIVGAFVATPIVVVGAFTLKVFADAALVFAALSFFAQPRSVGPFMIGEVMHVPYIVGAAVWGAMAPYRWKDRQH